MNGRRLQPINLETEFPDVGFDSSRVERPYTPTHIRAFWREQRKLAAAVRRCTRTNTLKAKTLDAVLLDFYIEKGSWLQQRHFLCPHAKERSYLGCKTCRQPQFIPTQTGMAAQQTNKSETMNAKLEIEWG